MPRISSLILLAFSLLLAAPQNAQGEDWPNWRGPRGDGSSNEQNIPIQWNAAAGENIAWKAPLTSHGHASPIVYKDSVFIAGCRESDQSRTLACLSRTTGKLLWEREVIKAPLEKKHKLNSFASGTPATDGELVYVTFLNPDFSSLNKRTPGEMIVAAYDLAGNRRWLVKPGRFASVHGFCSSPVLFEDKVIVNGDHDGDSYIAALDRATGKTIWKIGRQHKTRSYVTPIIREIDGRTQMILSGSKSIVSLDPRDGSQHWFMNGPTEQFVASLVYNGKLLFMTAGFPEHHILAIRPDGRGDVTDSHVVWRTTKACSYVPSPIVLGDYFLIVSDGGIGSCFHADSGKLLWRKRLGPHYSASAVSAGGLIYFLADDGVMKIVRPGEKFELVAENPLGEYCHASPAVSQGQLFLRGQQHLFCIGAPKK